jgi:hypothetical protein
MYSEVGGAAHQRSRARLPALTTNRACTGGELSGWDLQLAHTGSAARASRRTRARAAALYKARVRRHRDITELHQLLGVMYEIASRSGLEGREGARSVALSTGGHHDEPRKRRGATSRLDVPIRTRGTARTKTPRHASRDGLRRRCWNSPRCNNLGVMYEGGSRTLSYRDG